jgi:hypothetical protein
MTESEGNREGGVCPLWSLRAPLRRDSRILIWWEERVALRGDTKRAQLCAGEGVGEALFPNAATDSYEPNDRLDEVGRWAPLKARRSLISCRASSQYRDMIWCT